MTRNTGLVLLAAGFVLLLARFIYDLAAGVSGARKEYRALSSSGLISDAEAPSKSRQLAASIEENRRLKAVRAQKQRQSRTSPKQQSSSTDGRTDPYATSPLEYLADGVPAPDCGRFDTVKLDL